ELLVRRQPELQQHAYLRRDRRRAPCAARSEGVVLGCGARIGMHAHDGRLSCFNTRSCWWLACCWLNPPPANSTLHLRLRQPHWPRFEVRSSPRKPPCGKRPSSATWKPSRSSSLLTR